MRFSKYTNIEIKECNRDFRNILPYSYCVNHSSLINRRKNILFFRQFFTRKYPTPKYKITRTWIEANKLCQSVGGNLPIMRSREELDELIALTKLSTSIPPIQGIFTGLVSTPKSKVNISLNTTLVFI